MRRFLLTIPLFASILLALACARKSEKVQFWHAMGGPLGDALKQLVDEFEKANPDIDIELVSMSDYGTLSQKLMAAVQVNNAPHMAQMYESWTSEFNASGKLLPIDSFVRGAGGFTEEELADFYPQFLDDNTWDGRLVTLPFNKSIQVFFHNADSLVAAGYAEFPKTWPEFRALAKRFSDARNGRYGTTGVANEGVFAAMLRQKGGDLLDTAQRRAVFNGPAGLEVAQFLYDLVNVDSSCSYGGGYETQNEFAAGRIVTMPATTASWAHFRPRVSFRLGVAALPTWGAPNVLSMGTNVGMFRTGTPEQQAQCWKFIRWFTAPEQQAKWAMLTFYVPVRRSALQVPGYARFVQETPGLAEVLGQLDYMSFEPKHRAWFNGRKAFGIALEQVMRGSAAPKAALDRAAAEVEKEFD